MSEHGRTGEECTTADADDSPNFEESNYSEICIIGRDLVDFNAIRFGSFIRRIDLSFNFLKTIYGLSICSESLEELILDNNQLEIIDLGVAFPKLNTLSLNKNRIWHMGTLLKELSSFASNLRFLSLLGNPICPDQLTNDDVDESDYPKYRCHILHHLKNIRFLDHRSVSLKELNESRKLSYANIKLTSTYTPLPSATRLNRLIRQRSISQSSDTNSQHQQQQQDGTPTTNETGPQPMTVILVDRGPKGSNQGKRRFKYIGKNSEGNRFIKDTDL